MPKIKTKSSVKKRFKITSLGKILRTQSGKRHGMIKRSNKFIRNARGMIVANKSISSVIRKYMPYS